MGEPVLPEEPVGADTNGIVRIRVGNLLGSVRGIRRLDGCVGSAETPGGVENCPKDFPPRYESSNNPYWPLQFPILRRDDISMPPSALPKGLVARP